jgi:hypothetical protein
VEEVQKPEAPFTVTALSSRQVILSGAPGCEKLMERLVSGENVFVFMPEAQFILLRRSRVKTFLNGFFSGFCLGLLSCLIGSRN